MPLSSSLSQSLVCRQQRKSKSFSATCRVSVTRDAGFTLLELMAVILIIGIIISFASLSIGQNTSRIVQDEAERLHGLVRLAGEEAVLQGRELALEFDRHRYQFLEHGSDGWQPLKEGKMFRERALPDSIEVELLLEGAETSFEDKKKLPRIFILSSGELTPFVLTLSIDEAEKYSMEGFINGKLVLAGAEDDKY